MIRKLCNVMMILALLVGGFALGQAKAQPIDTPSEPTGGDDILAPVTPNYVKPIDQPNTQDYLRNLQRRKLLEAGKTAEAEALTKSGYDRILVLLVEFTGTDVITWTVGDHWDPLGLPRTWESTGITGDCSKIITQTTAFTYGPTTHNQLPVPTTVNNTGQVWTPDFSQEWYKGFMFQDGVVVSYTAQDGTKMHEDFTGQSVKQFYSDMSNGTYTITGDVVGWLPINHSMQWYGADTCPGRLSGDVNSGQPTVAHNGAIPGAGSAQKLVRDAISAVNAKISAGQLPGFNWEDYDQNPKDGKIDRLWIIHSGLGEEEGSALANVPYGEFALWSHSSSVTPVFSATQTVAAGPYIMMPENGGIGVFAHEYAHNLGAADLYSYAGGETSAGFWTTMADDWTGYPLGFEPPAQDPLHLDEWGWLHPLVITDTSKVYEFNLGQASNFPGGDNTYRGAKIVLPDNQLPLPATVWSGSYYWWGGKVDQSNARMTSLNAISIPVTATNASLSFDLAYDVEPLWDFFWVQASTDGGSTWNTLTNTNTTCDHDAGWIGADNGFPEDMCAAGIGGFTGTNAGFPASEVQTFDLTKFKGESIKLRFWYMTDWATTQSGPFMDNIKVAADAATIFQDDAEAGDANWVYEDPWVRSTGYMAATHNFYLQWRNTNANGGYDSALGDPRFRFGPANTGLLVWYNDNFYSDNEIPNYMTDYPGYGTKGMMLVVDSSPAPYRDPYWVANGYDNEGGNLHSRMQVRDATFTLAKQVDFDVLKAKYSGVYTDTHFTGRPAVSVFHDALGYYPGAEYVSRGPGYTPPSYKWVTVMWDGSVVVPSTKFYGIKAPGYVGSGAGQQEFRYQCTRAAAGRLGCYWFGTNTGLGYDGSNGNPADVDGQYGWHVQVVSEAADHSYGTVRVWNSMKSVDTTFTPSATSVKPGDVVTYTVDVKNTGSKLTTMLTCVPLDTARGEYVAGSAPDAILLTSCPTSDGAALSKASAPNAVGALAWLDLNPAPGDVVQHIFVLKAKEMYGSLIGQSMAVADGKVIYTPALNRDTVQIVWSQMYLPFINLKK